MPDSEKLVSNTSIFPVAFGHEQETGRLISIGNEFYEPKAPSTKTLQRWIPDELIGSGVFLTNGFKVYPTGGKIIEIATPECINPIELVRYRRAAELLAEKVLQANLVELSGYKFLSEATIRGSIHNRVVDISGNRKSSHYSVGLNDLSDYPLDYDTITQHQATRGFVSGAGHVTREGYRFSQKINGLVGISGYGFLGTMYRVDNNDGTTRFEDRCADINISDWATWMHAGSLALAVAVSRTPLKKDLPKLKTDGNIIEFAKKMNLLGLGKDGSILRHKDRFVSVDFQQKLAELAMAKLDLYIDDLPQEYFEVARALFNYCELFRKFMNGKVEVDDIAYYADWAAKLNIVMRRHAKDARLGIRRDLFDSKSRVVDLGYDYRHFTAQDGEIIDEDIGLAFRLRDRDRLATLVTEQDVARALGRAPESTRAKLRTHLLRRYEVSGCDWAHTRIVDEDGNKADIKLPDVTATSFTDEQMEQLMGVKEKLLA